MPPVLAESLGVLAALTLMILGAGALIGYVIVNHEPVKEATATTAEQPGVGGGRVAGAGKSGGAPTSAGATSAPATTTSPATTQAATTQASAGGGADLAAGKKVFASAGCGACHTLADAGTNGNVGPNLDDLKPNVQTVSKQVVNGGSGMPPFKGQLTPQQIEAVAKYVAGVAGKT
jgi:mono/diheme cytochrome c family protein